MKNSGIFASNTATYSKVTMADLLNLIEISRASTSALKLWIVRCCTSPILARLFFTTLKQQHERFNNFLS
jgi:hypothetical protein